MKPDLPRRRAAVAGLVAAIAGSLGYACERGYAHIGASDMVTIVIREQRVNFYLALAIALFIAVLAGLVTAELASSEARLAALERALERLVLPLLGLAVVLMFYWP